MARVSYIHTMSISPSPPKREMTTFWLKNIRHEGKSTACRAPQNTTPQREKTKSPRPTEICTWLLHISRGRSKPDQYSSDAYWRRDQSPMSFYSQICVAWASYELLDFQRSSAYEVQREPSIISSCRSMCYV